MVSNIPDNQVFKINQTIETLAALTSSNVATTFYSLSFSLSLVDQVTALTNLFDQYRLDMVEVMLIPRLEAQISAPGNNGLLHSVVDYDDANNLTTAGDALDYDNCLVTSGLNGHYRRFVPHLALAAYSGAFTSFANSQPTWIDAASTGVQHYGVKFALTPAISSQIFDMVARLHFSFKNVR
jgi:hypothetical protein